jgi:serine/threonine protein kinase
MGLESLLPGNGGRSDAAEGAASREFAGRRPTVSPRHATGDLALEQYELAEKIGAGGFAAVYRAIDTENGSAVAVKYPNYEGSRNERGVIDKYFGKEVGALRRIRDAGGHDNLMSLITCEAESGTEIMVVEFVDGYELDDAIHQTGPLTDVDEVRQIGIDLCDAMSFLHENEIVYRDLKPDNVMITDRDGIMPVLIDFNTATGFDPEDTEDGDQATTIIGPYKPREIAEADQTDSRQGPWSDVYSVGKILVYLLTGTVPHRDGVDPREFGASCDPALAETVKRATRTEPTDRYRNATAMKRVLEERDPSLPPAAVLRHVEADTEHTIYPGDTIGRRYSDDPAPSVVIEDDDEHVSAVQVQFDTDDDGEWLVRDRSLNGTYVRTEGGWQRVLGDHGRDRLEERGKDPTDRNGEMPPTSYGLMAGDRVALVHPTYGVTFEFEPE